MYENITEIPKINSGEKDNEKLNKPEVVAEIRCMIQQIHQEGSFDTEHDELESIIKEMNENKITPERAQELANNIMKRRQSYR